MGLEARAIDYAFVMCKGTLCHNFSLLRNKRRSTFTTEFKFYICTASFDNILIKKFHMKSLIPD